LSIVCQPWNSFPMTQTGRYCVQCLVALISSSNATTDEERAILSAMRIITKGDTYGASYKFADGLCRKCGRDSVVVYYEIPEQ
jgi:hypothetical protein